MSENITHVTDSSFDQEVLNADGPVLVDYWAEWCGPCKMIAPIVEAIAAEYGDKLKVTKMDTDSNMQTPQQYSIRGIPTCIIFKGGRETDRRSGAIDRDSLVSWISSHL